MRIADRDNNSGQAFLLVLVAVSVLLALAGSLLLLTRQTKDNIIGEQRFIQALYAADAGIEKTTAKIITEMPDGPPWYTNLSDNGYSVILNGSLPGNARFNVQAQKAARSNCTSLLLRSVGECMDDSGKAAAKKTVEADAAVFTTADYFRGLGILPEAPLLLDNTGYMTIVVHGDLFLNGTLKAIESLQVNGIVYASSTVTGNYPHEKRSNYSYIPPFPKLNSRHYEERAASDEHLFYVDAVFTNLPGESAVYEGFYFIDGDVDISGDYTGSAVFFATGDITISGDLTPRTGAEDNPDITTGDLTLIALGDIKLNNCTVYANLLACGLEVGGNIDLHGTACVKKIISQPGESGSGKLTIYDDNVRIPYHDAIPTAVKIVNWRETYQVF